MNRDAQQSATRRSYRLTPEGLASLRSSALRLRPWERSTGPRTPSGKAVTRQNALKHGQRSAEEVRRRREVSDTFRLLGELKRYWDSQSGFDRLET